MLKVDARGDACPLPVVKAKKAIAALAGAGEVEVLVDNEIAVQNLTKMAKQKGCQSDVHRFPLSEDHNRKCKEAKTCNSVLEFPLADAGCDINQSAKSAKSTGDQNACITHFEHIDTYRVSCLGMLAACHKTKSESGFV